VAGSGGNAVTGAVGSCAGGDVEHYPNGMIPISALCQLAAQPGQYLRADAAAAFDRMSRAYAARFGAPLCVTDSYRTYAEQVRLKAEKPTLAATPGTSNHGWGTATDLCGGIESFGTPEHEWLATNAPLYNWFHPSWARETAASRSRGTSSTPADHRPGEESAPQAATSPVGSASPAGERRRQARRRVGDVDRR
jgi:hypothetical protein